MTPLVNLPEGYKLVPTELSDEQALIVANREVDDVLQLQNRSRKDYIPSQLNSWIERRATEAKKRYVAALSLLSQIQTQEIKNE